MTTSSNPSAPAGLRWWLILLTLAALLCGLAALGFGWAINLDTELHVTPKADPDVRGDAVGLRLFAWGTIGVFILLLILGVAGGWRAFRRRQGRRALGLSMLAAAPMFLAASSFLYFVFRGDSW